MKTTIVEVTWTHPLLEGYGWGNGYVIIPKGHPLYGKDYRTIHKMMPELDVHGGLTYSTTVDTEIIRHMNLDQEDRGQWIVGFDTLHYGDTAEYWTKKRVQGETNRLKKQLMSYKEEK